MAFAATTSRTSAGSVVKNSDTLEEASVDLFGVPGEIPVPPGKEDVQRRGRKLRLRLLMTLVPSIVIILMATGLATYWASSEFIAVALGRFSRMHAATTAHAVEVFLERCRTDVLFAATQPVNPEDMGRYLTNLQKAAGQEYVEFGFIPLSGEEHIVLVSHGDVTVRVPHATVKDIRPSPVLLYREVEHLAPGEVWVSQINEVEYPFPTEKNPHNRIALPVLRFVTPCLDSFGRTVGFTHLAVDARKLRNILSLYDSKESPVSSFPRNLDLSRYTFYFDAEGWILFQSESIDRPEAELSTLGIRAVKRGTLGRPGLSNAFRPIEDEERYWELIQEVREDNKGLLRVWGVSGQQLPDKDYFLAYAPVHFRSKAGEGARILGGVAFVDRSSLIELAGYNHFDVMVVITVLAVLAVTLVIVVVSRRTTSGLMELAQAVEDVRRHGKLVEIDIADKGYEASVLKDAINSMIHTIRDQFEEIKVKDFAIESVALKEPAVLEIESAQENKDTVFPEFIGGGPFMEQLKHDIAKAGQVDVDVLIVGETGTGKQLAAEAVHRLSRRADKPFISINCGELDENLLLDTLFGHVKGAFTDGKTDRRGAFQEADGGTLFLDEIQSSSLKVQQALLRAISMRKVKPLGSDKEQDVDVRLITATNADLKELIEQRTFREDLYYRLKVITIATPPLREQKENIPALTRHFLREAEHMAGRTGLSLSKGALELLINYHWPGNIRELKHAIITAAVMVEDKVIQVDQLNLDEALSTGLGGGKNGSPRRGLMVTPTTQNTMPPVPSEPTELLQGLNPRQITALEHVQRTGELTTRDYMELVPGGISKRTATYDIQGMVGHGLLVKVGKGPATRYVPAERTGQRPSKREGA